MSIYMLRSTSPGAWINKWNKLYRRQSVAGIRIRTGLNHEDDYYYACEVNACIRRKVIVGRALYAYRRNPESVTSALNHERYFLACCERIRLSQVEFLNAGRIPPRLAHSFRCELANDAYRMCIRKNLKKNKNAKERRRLFTSAGAFFLTLERDAGFRPIGLTPIQQIVYNACLSGHYWLARTLVAMT